MFSSSGPLKVLFAGDSLTAGYLATTQDNGYSLLVMTELHKKGAIDRFGTNDIQARPIAQFSPLSIMPC